MTQISSYYSKVGISVDLAQLKKVDRYLKLLEAKMMAFQKRAMRTNGAFNINFKFNTNRLQFDVQKAFNDVSRRVSFPINRFDINRAALASSINSAVRAAMAGTNATLRINPRVNQQPQGRPLPGQQITGRHAAMAGGTAGMLGRYGAPAIIGGAAIYGGSALNRANQEAMSMRLTTQAVVQAAGGTEQQGKDAFGWLRNLANEVGFSYKDAAPDYNQFLANAQGAGLDIGESQNIFQGLSEYQTAMGVTPARRKLVMNAASQMLGKQTLSMEELRRQMAESLPGTMDIFGEAFAEMSGSGLKGPDALKALYEAVPTGTVNSAEILKHVDVIMRRRAAPKLDVMKKTSIAEQGRAQNLVSDFMDISSKAGLEEGFSRIFRTFTDGLSQSSGLVERLARGFNEITKEARSLLLFPQSFIRALEGKDSVVADWLGVDKTRQMVEDWEKIKALFQDIIGIETPSWLPTLEATAKEIAAIMNMVAAFQKWREGAFPTTRATDVSTPVDAGRSFVNNAAVAIGAAKERGRAVYEDPSSIYYKDPVGYDTQMREQAVAAMQSGNTQNTMSIGSINVEVNAADFAGQNPSDMAQQLADKIAYQVKEQILGDAWQMYPQTQ